MELSISRGIVIVSSRYRFYDEYIIMFAIFLIDPKLLEVSSMDIIRESLINNDS